MTYTVSLVRKRPLPGELYFDQDEAVSRKLFCRLRFAEALMADEQKARKVLSQLGVDKVDQCQPNVQRSASGQGQIL